MHGVIIVLGIAVTALAVAALSEHHAISFHFLVDYFRQHA